MMKRIKRRLAAAGLLLCLFVFSTSVYAQSEITSDEEQAQEQDGIKDKDKETSEQEDTSEDGSEEEETSEDGLEEEETSEDGETSEEDTDETLLPWQTPSDDETADTGETADPEEDNESPGTPEPADLPPGNLTLAEDVISTKYGNREFLTVYSREGDYFYIIIDRDTEGAGNVWFLNMVDDQDLYSLVGEKYPGSIANKEADKNGNAAAAEKVCTCVNHCPEGDPDASCPVCSEDPSKCRGIKPAADLSGTGEKDAPVLKKPELNLPVLAAGATGLILLILVYALKIRKKGKKAKVPEYDIDNYLMDDDETEEEYDDDNDD